MINVFWHAKMANNSNIDKFLIFEKLKIFKIMRNLNVFIYIELGLGSLGMQMVDLSYVQEAHPTCRRMCENVTYKCIADCTNEGEIDCIEYCAEG